MVTKKVDDRLDDDRHGYHTVGRAEEAEEDAVERARALDAELRARKDEIECVQFSALMDGDTCPSCAALDGKRFPFGSEEYYRTMPPYSGCTCEDGCRCVHLYLMKNRTV